MHVLRFLKPLDIVSLRLTTKKLVDLTFSRSVWLTALRTVIDDNGLFPPTFPLHKMSIEELENAALGPQKFSRLIRQPPSGDFVGLEAVSRRSVLVRDPNDPTAEVESIRLLPGGRFLIVETNAAVLFMDLGWRVDGLLSSRPFYRLRKATVSGLQTPAWVHVDHLTWGNCPGDLRLFFSVDSDNMSERGAQVIVCDVFNLDGAPKGEVIARLALPTGVPQRIRVADSEGDRVLLHLGSLTSVWDLNKNEIVSFSNSQQLWHLSVLVNDSVISYDQSLDSLNVYNVPRLGPMTPLMISSNPPAIALRPLNNYDASTVFHRDGQHCFFDIEGNGGIFVRYSVDRLPPNVSKARTMPFVAARYDLTAHFTAPSSRHNVLPALRLCDDGIVTTVMDVAEIPPDGADDDADGIILAHIANRGWEDGDEEFQSATVLMHSGDPAWRLWDSFEMDPTSGRLCVMVGLYLCVHDHIAPSRSTRQQ